MGDIYDELQTLKYIRGITNHQRQQVSEPTKIKMTTVTVTDTYTREKGNSYF